MTSKQGKSLLSRIDATSSGYDAAFSSLCSRRFAFDDKINRSVEEIVAQVRDRGDSAVREFTKSYDGISTDVLEVSEDEWHLLLPSLICQIARHSKGPVNE